MSSGLILSKMLGLPSYPPHYFCEEIKLIIRLSVLIQNVIVIGFNAQFLELIFECAGLLK